MRVITFINRLDAHHKLGIALLVGSLAVVLTSSVVEKPVNWMIGWLAYGAVHLGLAWVTILSSHPAEVRREVDGQDSSRVVIFLFVVVASFVSLFAILYLLYAAGKTASWSELTLHFVLSFSCIVCSWILVHTIFTLRYAHLYYRTSKDERDGKKQQKKGLDFPGDTEPDYLDFTYFSFVIGMTFQVSDVTISSREIRRLALVHALLSFVFNTLLVALTINVVSGLIQNR
ncbi:DUF1345 domain-containing protein [Dyadobacter jiangsuensis]|uniref:Putative membrane protein n=1 Tax=Dyadobacter jiangsuensis TaxID=1591085 RepID=A0A2P8GBL2_9BACT|nr:DUF1345 domain-containing protein [Dyadobacter jiangsuensis]PSL31364.1 putative membrane protein [Dyadobacter jiangsuensis]